MASYTQFKQSFLAESRRCTISRMNDSNGSVFDRLLDKLAQRLTPDAARAIAEFRVDADMQARIDELGDKCSHGQLTAEERRQYEDIVEAIDMIAVLQDKARAALEQTVIPG